jgi:hypothetical protein
MESTESEELRSTAEMRRIRRRRGQTTAEFAITLPILLLLLFGVIEFGRIFQAWVTLQNAARTAARYASTGQYDEDRFFLTSETDSDPNQADGLVPCLETHDIGTETTFRGVTIYTGAPESIFATWYNGIDCDPTNEFHQALRRDMARILSIMDEARAGAAGLALGDFFPPTTLPTSYEPEDQPWYYVWDRPDGTHLNGSDTPGWFNLMLCSTRAKIQSSETEAIDGNVLYTQPQYIDNRFKTAIEAVRDQDSRAPVCVLNEYSADSPSSVPPETRITLDNAGAAWLDAGGPGDTVSLVVTFNHPLVTPIGLAEFIPLQARRTAVVESFRSSRASRGLTGAGPILAAVPSRTPTYTLSDTPSRTATFIPSSALSLIQSYTPSKTATSTASIMPSTTRTRTPSITPTRTLSSTPSRIPIDMATLTHTPSRTPSPSPTYTPTRTYTPTPSPPDAVWVGVPNDCTHTATFTNNSTNVTSYTWSFTSGTPASSTSANPGTITFPAGTGTYSVSLTVTGPNGVDVDTHNISFSAGATAPSLSISLYQPLTPSPIYFNPNEGDTLKVGQQITFSAITQGSSGSGNSTADTYEWVVVPGNVSTFPASPSPTSGTTYAWIPSSTGTYTIFLRGTNDCSTATLRLPFTVTTSGGGGGE